LIFYNFGSNYLGFHGIVVHTSPSVNIPARNVSKSVQPMSRSTVPDSKIHDAMKSEEKMVSRSSRLKTKGADEQDGVTNVDESDIGQPNSVSTKRVSASTGN
jgi:hypothetical protein